MQRLGRRNLSNTASIRCHGRLEVKATAGANCASSIIMGVVGNPLHIRAHITIYLIRDTHQTRIMWAQSWLARSSTSTMGCRFILIDTWEPVSRSFEAPSLRQLPGKLRVTISLMPMLPLRTWMLRSGSALSILANILSSHIQNLHRSHFLSGSTTLA